MTLRESNNNHTKISCMFKIKNYKVYENRIWCINYLVIFLHNSLRPESFLCNCYIIYTWLHTRAATLSANTWQRPQYRLIFPQSMPEKRWYSIPRRAENAALLVYNLIRAVERSANLSAFIVGLESHLLSVKDRRYPSTARNARSEKTGGKRSKGNYYARRRLFNRETTSNLDGRLASRQHFDFAFLGAFARLSVPPLRLRRTWTRPPTPRTLVRRETRPRTLPGAAPPCSFVLSDPGSAASLISFFIFLPPLA